MSGHVVDLDDLRAMRDHDPDGWECVVPTDEDRARFRAWAVERYGVATWTVYVGHAWDASAWED